jgi:hypothetical protein
MLVFRSLPLSCCYGTLLPPIVWTNQWWIVIMYFVRKKGRTLSSETPPSGDFLLINGEIEQGEILVLWPPWAYGNSNNKEQPHHHHHHNNNNNNNNNNGVNRMNLNLLLLMKSLFARWLTGGEKTAHTTATTPIRQLPSAVSEVLEFTATAQQRSNN